MQISSENTILSVKTYSTNINLSEDKKELLENKKTKQQRMEKLNRIGTSLIENKLLQVNGKNINDKFAQTDLLPITEKSKSVGTSPNKKRSMLKRTFSENKSIQTSFVEEDIPEVASVGVQMSFHVTDDLHMPVENITYQEHHKNATESATNINLFHSTSQYFNFEDNIENINIFQSNQNSKDPNNMTFVSHYNLKLREQCRRIQETPLIEVNTKDALANLSTMLFKKINKVDNKCKVFGNVLGKEVNSGNYQSPIEDVTFNADYGNTSKFFTMKSNTVTKQCTKNDKKRWNHKYNLSILLDTNEFFERQENDEICHREKFQFNNLLQNSAKYNDSCNQTLTSFKQFIPPMQSTQKEERYNGKIHDFFQSFLFEDYRRIDTQQIISDMDNNVIENVYEQEESNNFKNYINEHEMQQLDTEGNMYHTNMKTGKHQFCLCK